MAKPRKSVKSNRRVKQRRLSGSLVLAVVIAIVAAVAFFTSERPRKVGPAKTIPPPITEHHKLPPRDEARVPPIVHEDYTGIVVHPPSRHALPAAAGRGGVVAIIIDDMGKRLQEARSLADIGVPLTFSIIPGLPKDRQVAAEAEQRGIELLIHMPMEPKGYPAKRLEENGLLLGQSDEEIRARVGKYLEALPQAVGANNHMGSNFTENREKMAVVLNILKSRGLFFIDSKTSPASIGYDLAEEMGVRSASRNVFLDNIQQADYISKQLSQAVDIARKRGSAIAICHPHPVTIQTLAAELPRLREEGVTFVPVSRLVH